MSMSIGVPLDDLSPRSNRISKLLEDHHCCVPIDAGVRDANALFECLRSFGWNRLLSLVQIGLDHHTNNGSLTSSQLVADCLCNFRLVTVIFVRISY